MAYLNGRKLVVKNLKCNAFRSVCVLQHYSHASKAARLQSEKPSENADRRFKQEDFDKRFYLSQILKTKKAYSSIRVSEKNYHHTQNLHVLSSDSLLLNIKGRIYFINTSNSSHRRKQLSGKSMPEVDSLFFTRFDLASFTGSLFQIFSKLPRSDTGQHRNINIFGPPCIAKYMRKLYGVLLPKMVQTSGMSNYTFHSAEVKNVIHFQDEQVAIKMFGLNHVDKKPEFSDNDNCDTSAYIFEYFHTQKTKQMDSDLDNTEEILRSWRDFDTIDQYVSYISNCHSKLQLSECSSTQDKELVSICIFDCPTFHHLEDLSRKFPLPESSTNNHCMLCVHMTPSDIYDSEEYKSWTRKFGPECSHIPVNEENMKWLNNLVTLPDIHRGINHILNPELFPLHANQHLLKYMQESLHALNASVEPGIYVLTSGQVLEATHPNCVRQTSKDLLTRLSNVKSYDVSHCGKSSKSYPSLVVLGSGGSQPFKTRSFPCYLLRVDARTSIMMDCGVDSLTQLYKHYGKEKALSILLTIKIIVLTHRHHDHWAGFIELMDKITAVRNKAHFSNQDKVKIFAPRKSLDVVRDCRGDYAEIFTLEDVHKHPDILERTAESSHLSKISFVKVDHSVNTFGVVIDTLNGKRIAYSSDTLPMSKNLIRQGQRADLLIHDCLLTNEKERPLADHRMHSTMQGAINTADAMNAKNLMLTHFSTRLGVLPVDKVNPSNLYEGNVFCAVDHLEASLDQLNLLPAFHDAKVQSYGGEVKHGQRLTAQNLVNDIEATINLLNQS
ncbi:zinc phosphodiesterase ELAC protein 2-like [Clavelina lepadiformis]|uniref:zinc phosphodiesterase ELAC protein 2-like n=1 Tax=Clavelina lepadiformis TaxID=159417 RepID=UPI004042EAE5